MSAEQLCFFKFSRPLVDLLGAEFFRQVPSEPGVYLFRGEGHRVLYVGQSKNLRQRLGYYKNAQPEREPRRIIRLVHQAHSLELQVCGSPADAEARELELIQEHQPRFNVRHALSRTYSFFGIRTRAGNVVLRLALEAGSAEGERVIGAFKNRGLCRRALFAMGRALWCAFNPVQSVYGFPWWLRDRTKVNELDWPMAGPELEELGNFVEGTADTLAGRVEANLAAAPDPFVKALFQADALLLGEFFALAVRMKELRERSGADGVLAQKEIDRVALARAQKAAREQAVRKAEDAEV